MSNASVNAGNQYNIILDKLSGDPTGADPAAFLNFANVTYELKNLQGTVLVAGVLTYISGSDGRYGGFMLVPVDTPIGSTNLYVVAVQNLYQRTFKKGLYISAPQAC